MTRHDNDPSPHDDPGPLLLALARQAIAARLGLAPPPRLPENLQEPGASFVTLTRNGELRGCIGSLTAWRPLAEDVIHNACAAAFEDPRFAPVSVAEWPQIRIEVSLLSPPQLMTCRNRADLLAQLRPGEDGLILAEGSRRATFLPQVWEQLPDPEDFLGQLCRKAGLPPSHWSPELRFWRYQVKKWKEQP